MDVRPVVIKLSFWEACALKDYFQRKSTIRLTADTRNEVIILVEFSEKFYTRCFAHGLKNKEKIVSYTIPLSIARILHFRLRHEEFPPAGQFILGKLDQQLTNRHLTPFNNLY